jgi:cell wall-associated NlpC family hydrolase
LFNYSDLLGVKYLKDGRDEKGFDCFGLIQFLHKRMGKDLPEYITQLDCEELKSPEASCIVLFKLGGNTFHVGMVLPDKQRFIHIMENKNVVLEKLDSRIWSKLRVGYYKWKA